jgi:4-azaleucine resistance transporter AzlC
MDPRREFLAGVRAEAPILLGVVPFGLIFGALALQAGIPAAPALAMSSIIFAGSAQFVATQMFATASPGFIMLLVTFVVNLRHVLYSASLAQYLTPLRRAWKAILAYLLTDEAYAVTITHYTETRKRGNGEPQQDHWFFLGAGLTLWVSWQVSTALGIFLGARIPAGWNLEFALPLTFIALARPTLTDRASIAAAVVSGVTAVLSAGVPMRLGIVIAALAGITAGIIAGRRMRAA